MRGGWICRLPPLSRALAAWISLGLILFLIIKPAQAARSSFRTYGIEQGLASLDVSCLHQDRGGFLLLCTQHGIFTYDGRRFANLGTTQGLRDGGRISGLSIGDAGRVALSYPDELFISDRQTDASASPNVLSFRPIGNPGISFFFDGEAPHHLVAWRSTFAFLANGVTFQVVLGEHEAPHLGAMSYTPKERQTLAGAVGVFSIRGRLWETFEDGRLCVADPGDVRCYNAPEGFGDGPWLDVVAGPGGRIYARSLRLFGTLDPRHGGWAVTDLPDQGGDYNAYTFRLGLFTTPDGEFVTQAAHGLDVLAPEGWRTLTIADGAPPGLITGAQTDSAGQFWLQIFGRGLARWVGYGRWENLRKGDGLSADVAWQTARSQDGLVWVATDNGVDRVVRRGDSLDVAEIVSGPAYALAIAENGDVWSSNGQRGVRVLHRTTGVVTTIDAPSVDSIAPDATGGVWLGTATGLFRVAGSLRPERLTAPSLPILDIKPDGSGGVFYIAGNQLRHRHGDGTDVPVSGMWPGGGFGPVALAFDHNGDLWIAGAGGLFRFVLGGDKVVALEAVPVADTGSNSVPAVMIDHRGWVWAGTSLGVSVFDGHSWVSIDADFGLVDDDVNQGGIREDPDGSVWIATTQGISHLLDPRWLFEVRPLRVMVSEALLGSRPATDQRVAYTRAALSVELGTPSFALEQSVQFRYRLSGVDSDWVTSASGLVRYPFVPPGRHTLTAVGVDGLTHRISAPVTLTIDIAYPWWERWWFEVAALLVVLIATAGLVHAIIRLRFRVIYARQAELRRLVDEQTAQLRFMAAHDKLTGLLSRTEIEERLAERLATGPVGEELVVALIDVDHFKKINDTYGHLAGDDVLRTLGRLVLRCLREGDCAGRYGGEEILLVLSDEDGGGADRILDLHHMVRGSPFPSKREILRITCSIGVAWAVHGDSWESLLGRADNALYDAKRGGRDRIVECPRTGQSIDAD